MRINLLLLNRETDINLNIFVPKPDTTSDVKYSVPVEIRDAVGNTYDKLILNWTGGYHKYYQMATSTLVNITKSTPRVISLKHVLNGHVKSISVIDSTDREARRLVVPLEVNPKKEDKKGIVESKIDDAEDNGTLMKTTLTVKTSQSYSGSREAKPVNLQTAIEAIAKHITTMSELDDESYQRSIEVTQPEDDENSSQLVEIKPVEVSLDYHLGCIVTSEIPIDAQIYKELDGEVKLSKSDTLQEVLDTLGNLEDIINNTILKCNGTWKPKSTIMDEIAIRIMDIISTDKDELEKYRNNRAGVDHIGRVANSSVKTYVLDRRFSDCNSLSAHVFVVIPISMYNDTDETYIVELGRLDAHTSSGKAVMTALDPKLAEELLSNQNKTVKSYMKVSQ